MVLYCTILWRGTVQVWGAVLYNWMVWYWKFYGVVLYMCMVLYCTIVQCGIVQMYGLILFNCIVRHCTAYDVSLCTVCCCTVHCMVWYCTAGKSVLQIDFVLLCTVHTGNDI